MQKFVVKLKNKSSDQFCLFYRHKNSPKNAIFSSSETKPVAKMRLMQNKCCGLWKQRYAFKTVIFMPLLNFISLFYLEFYLFYLNFIFSFFYNFHTDSHIFNLYLEFGSPSNDLLLIVLLDFASPPGPVSCKIYIMFVENEVL